MSELGLEVQRGSLDATFLFDTADLSEMQKRSQKRKKTKENDSSAPAAKRLRDDLADSKTATAVLETRKQLLMNKVENQSASGGFCLCVNGLSSLL